MFELKDALPGKGIIRIKDYLSVFCRHSDLTTVSAAMLQAANADEEVGPIV